MQKPSLRSWLIDLAFLGLLALAMALLGSWLSRPAKSAEVRTVEEMATVACYADEGNGVRSRTTGVIFAVSVDQSSALVATCSHLFDDPRQTLSVSIPNVGDVPARLVYWQPKNEMEIAVLEIHPPQPVPFVPLADEAPQPGVQTLIIGFPTGGNSQVHYRGQVVAAGRWSMPEVSQVYGQRVALFETSDQVPSGVSGAPVFAGGKVVGIVWGSNDTTQATPANWYKHAFETGICAGGSCAVSWYPQGKIIRRTASQPQYAQPRQQPAYQQPPPAAFAAAPQQQQKPAPVPQQPSAPLVDVAAVKQIQQRIQALEATKCECDDSRLQRIEAAIESLGAQLQSLHLGGSAQPQESSQAPVAQVEPCDSNCCNELERRVAALEAAMQPGALAQAVSGSLPPLYVRTIDHDGKVRSRAEVTLGGTLNLHHQIIEPAQ